MENNFINKPQMRIYFDRDGKLLTFSDPYTESITINGITYSDSILISEDDYFDILSKTNYLVRKDLSQPKGFLARSMTEQEVWDSMPEAYKQEVLAQKKRNEERQNEQEKLANRDKEIDKILADYPKLVARVKALEEKAGITYVETT